jgi:hypothetical protein
MKSLYISSISIALYAAMLKFIYRTDEDGKYLFCGYNYEQNHFITNYSYCAFGAFTFSILVHIKRLFNKDLDDYNVRNVLLNTLVINALGGFSLLINAIKPNACVDHFG